MSDALTHFSGVDQDSSVEKQGEMSGEGRRETVSHSRSLAFSLGEKNKLSVARKLWGTRREKRHKGKLGGRKEKEGTRGGSG